jgi:VHL beta domain
MWEAIKYVGSGFTLIAFLFAVGSIMYRQYIMREEKLIKTAPEEQRPILVKDALEFFGVDTAQLTQSQQYDIALEQIRARGKRFQISATVIVVVTIVAAGTTAYAIYENLPKPRPVAVNCSAYSSTSGTTPAVVHFKNSSNRTVQVYWIDYHGKLNYQFDIGPDGTYKADSFISHSWCIKDTSSGQDILAVVVKAPDQDVDIPPTP